MFGDKRRPSATIAAEIDRIIGLNIRRARDDVRLGQHDVATLLGISVHVLARYEDGQERAPAAVLLELTRHLGCQLTDLFAGMPSVDGEDDFTSTPQAEASLPQQRSGDLSGAPVAAAVASVAASGGDDALAVTDIIKAFSDLKNPVLRERLLGLLQVLA